MAHFIWRTRPGGIRLTGNLAGKLELNSQIQGLGFFRNALARPTLEDTEVFPGRSTSKVSPVKITTEAALSGVYDGRLIEVQGFLREVHRAYGDWVFTVGSGRSRFSAMLEHPRDIAGGVDLRKDAMVQLTGICANSWDTSVLPPSPTEFRLLMRTPQDLVVLRKAPWLTRERAMMLVGALAGILLLAAGWLTLLSRRVSAQTIQLRKQMEHREHLESQLRQSQKLESVGRLAGGIAHDFNNLLTVINGYSEYVMSELKPSAELAQSVAEIKKAGEKAALLTGQLLAFSRKQILQPVVLDLNGLVAEMDNMLRRQIGEDIELVTLLSSEPCRVLADPGQLSQVLMNLAANARDAMPEGGRLVIETANVVIDAGIAENHAEVLPGEYVRLAVSDCGSGMDAETVAQLFEPFFTTKGLGRGTGLGLSTVFGIIKQSGGHIWVYSEPGHGTTFKIHLPRATGEDVPLSASKSRGQSAGEETILIVEDQPEVRALIVKSLSAQGYRVLETSNGDEALAIASTHVGPVHLLLTDVVMPGISGKVLAERLLDLHPGIRVLYMSGYTENVVAHKGILDAGINYLQKPFSPSTLSARVREVLEKNDFERTAK
jgi:signal transduction histidine kinase/ActR/RegA family two-component response regulator